MLLSPTSHHLKPIHKKTCKEVPLPTLPPSSSMTTSSSASSASSSAPTSLPHCTKGVSDVDGDTGGFVIASLAYLLKGTILFQNIQAGDSSSFKKCKRVLDEAQKVSSLATKLNYVSSEFNHKVQKAVQILTDELVLKAKESKSLEKELYDEEFLGIKKKGTSSKKSGKGQSKRKG